MKSLKFTIILLFFSLSLSAQFTSYDSIHNNIEHSLGIGASSQFTKQISPYYRVAIKKYIAPKFQLYGAISYTHQSVGDTFSTIEKSYYNDGLIVASESNKYSVTKFSMADVSFGVRYIFHEKLAVRVAPALTQVIKGHLITEEKFVATSQSGSTIRYGDQLAIGLNGIKNTLTGLNLGVDISICKWLSLEYSSYLRFTDITDDEIYGIKRDRIMRNKLSLNYVIR